MTSRLPRISAGVPVGERRAPGRARGSGRRPPSRAPCCGRSGARPRRGRRAPSGRPRRTPAPPPRAGPRPARRAARTPAPSRARGRRRAAARRRGRALAGGRLRAVGEAEQLEQRRPPARAPRAGRLRRRAPRPRRSHARSAPRNERLCWKVRAIPARPRRCGLQPVTSRSSSSTVPGGRDVEAGEHVDERRLPGAVRPDQADDLVPVQLERRRRRARCTPVERARHGGGPERSSGPPACVADASASAKT